MQNRRTTWRRGAIAACAALAVACLAGCGGGSTSPAAGSSSTGANASGAGTQAPGVILSGSQLDDPGVNFPRLAAPSSSGKLIGWSTSVAVTGVGTASSLGHGGARLVPAKGQHFVLASLALGAGSSAGIVHALNAAYSNHVGGTTGDQPVTLPTGNGTLAVSVDGGSPSALQVSGTATVPLLVSAPSSARSVFLTYTEGALVEAVDLLTGQVTQAPPAALSRSGAAGSSVAMKTVTYVQKLTGINTDTSNEQDTIQAGPAFLTYFSDNGSPIAPSAGQAELVVYANDGLAHKLSTTLTIAGSTPITGTDGTAAWGKEGPVRNPTYPVTYGDTFLFTVPAGFTSGTLNVIPSDFTLPAPDGRLVNTFNGASASFPISFPAG